MGEEEIVGGSEQITPPAEEVVVDKYEERARAQGWKPKEEFDGDAQDWRPAKEFVERGELFDKIHMQSNEIKDLKKSLNFLVDHHRKVKETEYNRALTNLKAMKKAAFEEGDADKIVELDEAIADVKEQQKQATADAPPQPKAPSSTFVAFVRDNPWYTTNKEMRDFADEVGVGYFHRNPGVAEADVHQYVLKRIKQAFPSEFTPKRVTPPAVEGAGNAPSGAKPTKEYQLTEDERRTMNTFVRQGVMSKEDYIKELKAIKGEA